MYSFQDTSQLSSTDQEAPGIDHKKHDDHMHFIYYNVSMYEYINVVHIYIYIYISLKPMTKAINYSNYSRPRKLRFANSSSSSKPQTVIALDALKKTDSQPIDSWFL